MVLFNAIFDVDGTLVDSMGLYQKIFTDIVAPFGISEIDAQKYIQDNAGLNLNHVLKRLFQVRGVPITNDALYKLESDFFTRVKKQYQPRLFPEVQETLKKLHDLSVMLFATSGSEQQHLEHLADTYQMPFTLMLGRHIPKGDKHIELFIGVSGCPCSEFAMRSLYLGDGPNDMRIAKRNGIFAVGITNTVSETELRQAGADVVITHFSEIIDIIKKRMII